MPTFTVDVVSITAATPNVRVGLIVRDSALLNDWADGYRRVRDSAVLNDIATPSWYRYAFDTAVIVSNNYETARGVHQDVLDTAVVVDSYDSLRNAPLNLIDSASITSNNVVYQVVTRQDVVNDPTPPLIVSYISEAYPRTDALDAAAVILSAAEYRAVVRVALVDAVAGNDSAYPENPALLRDDPAVITSLNLVSFRTTRVDAIDPTPPVITSVEVLGGDAIRVDVVEVAPVVSIISAANAIRETVSDQAFLESWIYNSAGVDQTYGWGLNDAWTADTGTWAMSRYTNVGITDLGTRFAVSNDGLFEKSAAFANARIETGSMDLGGKMKKRLSAMYIQGSYDNGITLDVTAEVDGVVGTYTYTPLTDVTGIPTTVRADVGRKMSSSYFKFAMESTGRAEFFGCEALVHASQRRI